MEEEFPIDPNKALSFSAPLYLYYTSPAPFESTNNINLGDFNFESCMNTATQDDSTSMSFADELFHSGVLLPLKPPPRLEKVRHKSKSGSSSPMMSSILKNPFARSSPSKYKEFDPFTVALEKIRMDEYAERDGESQFRRRSRSLSPMKNLNWIRKMEKLSREQKPNNVIDAGTSEINRKIMSKEKKRFVPTEMRKPIVSYKPGFFMCFGFGL